MLKIISLIMIFCSGAILGAEIIAPLVDQLRILQKRRAERAAEKMENMFLRVKLRNFVLLYTVIPIAIGIIAYIIAREMLVVLFGVAVGFLLPGFMIKIMEANRMRKFHQQLVDGLMVLSSSLKGGLSLIQAMEVLVEEMPAPINQEFGMVLAENKIGISLEDSFTHLYKRMSSPELNQLITAILLARETGGNLPVIFNRLVYTIRENDKINSTIHNLTLQGRLQGMIMCALPIIFAVVVHSFNPHTFDEMLQTDTGRNLLVYSVFSQLIGMFLIARISKLDI